jgi:hypothetical protein
MEDDYLKKLVIARLKTIPPDVSFSVGSYGDFTRDEIITQVKKGSAVGKDFAHMELDLLINTPNLVRRLSEKKKIAGH